MSKDVGFSGIFPEARMLLAENRFRDSRDFYEENKERIKEIAVEPMRQIAGILGNELSALDPYMNTVPTKMVSRVRRDTRYTKDQHLYRENLWVMFMRPKHEWPHYPCMWFEFTPRAYSLGIGLFCQTPGLLEFWRKGIRENPEAFCEAVAACEKTGAVIDTDCYKRPKEGCPEGLEKYYNCKSVYFMIASENLTDLEDETIIKKLKKYYKGFSSMYEFMLQVADAYVESVGGLENARKGMR